MSKMIINSKENGLLTVTLNYPEKHNCMGFEMLNQLEAEIKLARTDDTVRALLIRGAGDKAFSSGANIQEFNSLDSIGVRQWIELGNSINNDLENLNKPTVAYINGYAMGGGLELALACDFRLISARAILAFPEVSNGWLPGWGGMARIRRLVGEANAKWMVLLGERMDSTVAKDMGVITRILEEGQEELQLNTFMKRIMDIKPLAYSMAKSALMDSMRTTSGTDVDFDVLAVQIAKENND